MISLPIWISSLCFALIHSVFATDWCKQWFYGLGISVQRYRLLYSLSALLLTALWLYYIHLLPDQPVYRAGGWLNWLLIAMQLAGLCIVLLSFKAFNAKVFLGLQQIPEHGEPFHKHGIYRHMRHPMYAGVMLALLASPAHSINSLNLALCISLYFIIGCRFEERRMLKEHPSYADYRKRVPAFVPWRTLFQGHSSS